MNKFKNINMEDDNLDYTELTRYSFVAFHLHSLNIKEINLLEYNIDPIYKSIDEEDIKKVFPSLTPKFEFNDKFKEEYKNLIQTIKTYFAIFLKFIDKIYSSLFDLYIK